MSTTPKFERRNDWDPLSDNGGPRVRISCGHITTSNDVKEYCRRKLDEGIYKFKCPALVEGTKLCNKPLSYQEVRRLARLSTEEMQYFEDTIARLAAPDYWDIQACPWCKTTVERTNLSNLCVQCTVCTAEQKKARDQLQLEEDRRGILGKIYLWFWGSSIAPIVPTAATDREFCWQCRKEWKGAAPRSDRCDNDGCIDQNLWVIRHCSNTALPKVKGVDECPSIRACPTCGQRVEHDKSGCKNIICPRCQVEFCFVCLKLKAECLKTSSYFSACSDGVAPRQTSIPVRRRN